MVDNGQHGGDPEAYVRGQRKDDPCAMNPGDCDEGLSFSIWEKYDYDPEVMIKFKENPENFPKKYIVSSGAEFDTVAAKACPGFAIFRQVQLSKFFV